MDEKRVTYLIGAGASANALPVVNGMNDRMKYFVEKLRKIDSQLNEYSSPIFDDLKSILEKINSHLTIDTYAKKLWYKKDLKNYNLLKRFLSCYLLFEQVDKESEFAFLQSYEVNKTNFKIDKNLELKINQQLDSRYDSFFATLLNNNKLLNPNINIVSWNYDMQFELAYSDFNFDRYNIGMIQDMLQVFPTAHINNYVDYNKSAIIKLNGTCNFINDINNSTFDIINEKFYAKNFSKVLLEVLIDENHNIISQLEFAWENDKQVNKAREYAHFIVSNSDIIVIIGYSFPTFNREVDRYIFSRFNDSHLFRTENDTNILNIDTASKLTNSKKIYIQDTPQNAPKIKERLKAIGNNLFDVAEIYDDVDQFLIPYEL